ncbi:hypothetical protein MSAN_01210800 [Mycena sanguinolenta]|uniref:Uncharacterized protein n=1 Tax=Mycena sanguinolenta TaxID=230812 RepID=A0A8H6YFF2_9AGAR|nr:hypothetical protein MSAN_01210800 [Mycena sanguinolenta]
MMYYAYKKYKKSRAEKKARRAAQANGEAPVEPYAVTGQTRQGSSVWGEAQQQGQGQQQQQQAGYNNAGGR